MSKNLAIFCHMIVIFVCGKLNKKPCNNCFRDQKNHEYHQNLGGNFHNCFWAFLGGKLINSLTCCIKTFFAKYCTLLHTKFVNVAVRQESIFPVLFTFIDIKKRQFSTNGWRRETLRFSSRSEPRMCTKWKPLWAY